MEQLVITLKHPLSHLPETFQKPNISFPLFRIKKNREMIEWQKNIVENKVEIELEKWCTAVKKLKYNDEKFFYHSIVPSIELINQPIEHLSNILILLRDQPFIDQSIFQWKFDMYLDIFAKMKNTFPDFEKAPREPQYVVEKIKEIVQKQVSYQDCIQLYQQDREKFRQEVIDKLPETKEQIKSGAAWVRNLNDKGVIKHLRTLPEFKNQNKPLATFLKSNFNQPFSIDSIRKELERLPE